MGMYVPMRTHTPIGTASASGRAYTTGGYGGNSTIAFIGGAGRMGAGVGGVMVVLGGLLVRL